MNICLQDCTRTIVFCNKIETCRKVENLLNRKGDGPLEEGLLVLPYHAAIEEGVRSKALKVRLTSTATPMATPQDPPCQEQPCIQAGLVNCKQGKYFISLTMHLSAHAPAVQAQCVLSACDTVSSLVDSQQLIVNACQQGSACIHLQRKCSCPGFQKQATLGYALRRNVFGKNIFARELGNHLR